MVNLAGRLVFEGLSSSAFYQPIESLTSSYITMNFMKKSLFALLLALGVSAFAALPAYAETAGKIKNATEAEVRQALTETVKATEDALAALKSGASEEVVQEHISHARQVVKRVEINRLDVIRTRASEKLKNARHALNNKEPAKAEALLTEALAGYQEMVRLF
jgi:hypothetical protein